MYRYIKNNYRVFVFQFGCTLTALSLGAVIGTSLEFASYKDKVFKNISIGEVPIGNESLESAFERVKAHYAVDTANTSLALNLENKFLEIPISTFIIESNINELVETAYAYSQNLSFVGRYKLLTGKDSKTFEVDFTYNDEAINNFVEEFIKLASRPSKNASISINPNGEILKVADTSGIHIDKEGLVNAIYSLLSPEASLTRLEITKARNLNAPITLDVAAFASPLEAAITKTSLDTIDTRVTSFSTGFIPGTGSDVNIALAAKTINGTLLMPGETFSYNEILGNTTLDKGYTYATVLVNSQPTKGVGGGVCQVSTTLYNAVLHTGLLPTERRPHSRPSTYVPLGLDATIDWGNIDFKFTNTHNYPLYISAYTASNKVYVDIYSNKSLLSTTYKFNSEVLKTLPSTTKYIHDSTLPSGSTQLVSKGSNGYQVRVSREIYVDGTLHGTSTLYQDTYAAIPTIYKIGT